MRVFIRMADSDVAKNLCRTDRRGPNRFMADLLVPLFRRCAPDVLLREDTEPFAEARRLQPGLPGPLGRRRLWGVRIPFLKSGCRHPYDSASVATLRGHISRFRRHSCLRIHDGYDAHDVRLSPFRAVLA